MRSFRSFAALSSGIAWPLNSRQNFCVYLTTIHGQISQKTNPQKLGNTLATHLELAVIHAGKPDVSDCETGSSVLGEMGSEDELDEVLDIPAEFVPETNLFKTQ